MSNANWALLEDLYRSCLQVTREIDGGLRASSESHYPAVIMNVKLTYAKQKPRFAIFEVYPKSYEDNEESL